MRSHSPLRGVFFFSAAFTATLRGAPAHAMSYAVETARTSAGREINLLRMEGVIQINETMGWRSAVSHLDPGRDSLVVVTSPGGFFPGGWMMTNLVEEFLSSQSASGRKVYALAKTDCSSMCVPLYHAFDVRLSFPNVRFGIHGVSAPGFGTNADDTRLYLDRIRKRAADRGDQRTIDWLKRMTANAAFSSSELTPFSAQQLADESSGLVARENLVVTEQQAVDRLDDPR